jgi:hypothetical protein
MFTKTTFASERADYNTVKETPTTIAQRIPETSLPGCPSLSWLTKTNRLCLVRKGRNEAA